MNSPHNNPAAECPLPELLQRVARGLECSAADEAAVVASLCRSVMLPEPSITYTNFVPAADIARRSVRDNGARRHPPGDDDGD